MSDFPLVPPDDWQPWLQPEAADEVTARIGEFARF